MSKKKGQDDAGLQTREQKIAHYERRLREYDIRLKGLRQDRQVTRDPEQARRLDAQIRHAQDARRKTEENLASFRPKQDGVQDRGLQFESKGLDHNAQIIRQEIAAKGKPVNKNDVERLGEIGASTSLKDIPELRDRFEGYSLKRGFEKPGVHGIDQIWMDREGNFLIAEAKGGRGRPGKTKDNGRQMSREWVSAKADEMIKKGDPLGHELKSALENNDREVQGVIVSTDKASGTSKILKSCKGIDGMDPNTGIIDYKHDHFRTNRRGETMLTQGSGSAGRVTKAQQAAKPEGKVIQRKGARYGIAVDGQGRGKRVKQEREASKIPKSADKGKSVRTKKRPKKSKQPKPKL